jgi:Trypsin
MARKWIKGRRHAQMCLTFYVLNKMDVASIPRAHRLPRQVYGLQTDVVAIGELEFAAQPGEQVEVNSAFISGMTDAGTLGAVLHDASGQRYILSNNHVMAQLDHAAVGTPIYQPTFPNEIGKLSFAIPLHPDPTPNDSDAAIARLNPGTNVTGLLQTIGQLASGEPVAPEVTRRVEKVGARTHHTRGKVESINGTFRIRGRAAVGAASHPTYVFRDVVLIRGETEDFCRAGDSGSLIVDSATRRPMALLMGRARDDQSGLFFGAACPVSTVLAQLSAGVGQTLSIHTTA